MTPADEAAATYAAFARAMGADPAAGRGFICNLWDRTYAKALVEAVLRPLGVDYLCADAHRTCATGPCLRHALG